MRLVSRQHKSNHFVVRNVSVERFNDPIAPMPDMFLAVSVVFAKTIGIGVSPYIHPMPTPSFTVTWIVQKPPHCRFIPLTGRVRLDRDDLFSRRRDAN